MTAIELVAALTRMAPDTEITITDVSGKYGADITRVDDDGTIHINGDIY